jgi:hypothetical protein
MTKPYINFCVTHEREWKGVLPVECCPWCEAQRLRVLCSDLRDALSNATLHPRDGSQEIRTEYEQSLIDAAGRGEGNR